MNIPQSGNCRVLLAEDDEVNRFVAMSILLEFGCTVEGAADGASAALLARGQRYDLILMDCEMPDLDGFGATARIRADEAERGLPRATIVALTANAMQGDRERCMAVGMDDYMSKPYRQQTLKAMLEKWAVRSGQAHHL